MHAYQAYRKNIANAWTRIDMLIAIYDGTIQAMDAGIAALQAGDDATLRAYQLRTTRLLLLILDGNDPDNSEVAARVRDLCVYCIQEVSTQKITSWEAARNVLITLREGFEGIREEAISLEAAGQIPSLSQSAESSLQV